MMSWFSHLPVRRRVLRMLRRGGLLGDDCDDEHNTHVPEPISNEGGLLGVEHMKAPMLAVTVR